VTVAALDEGDMAELAGAVARVLKGGAVRHYV
jgi:hypothetical protein